MWFISASYDALVAPLGRRAPMVSMREVGSRAASCAIVVSSSTLSALPSTTTSPLGSVVAYSNIILYDGWPSVRLVHASRARAAAASAAVVATASTLAPRRTT